MMRSDWILDVLADLKTFATANNLPLLAEQLDDTALVALAEIASVQQKQGVGDVNGHAGRTDFGEAGASEHA